MNVAIRKPMALAEFLAWEHEQDRRYEFDGEQPVAMTGGTAAHSIIATNLVRALEDRLSRHTVTGVTAGVRTCQ